MNPKLNTGIDIICDKTRTLKDSKHPLVIRLTKNRKRRYISLGIAINPQYWDFEKNKTKRLCPNKELIENTITEKISKYQKQVLELQSIGKDYSLIQLINLVEQRTKNITVKIYLENIIDTLISNNKVGNANHYKALLNSLNKFTQISNLLFVDIDSSFLNKYETFLKSTGNKGNTISIKMRTLKATYNKAIKDNVIKPELYPFTNYNISRLKETTVKRAITKDDVLKFINFDTRTISRRPQSLIQFSKDLFLFSYLSCGINVIDIAYLKKENIFGDKIIYTRHKTNKPISFPLQLYSHEIMKKYQQQDNDYLFPILNDSIHITTEQQIRRIKKITYVVNKNLKKIGENLGLSMPLTTYVARHSFATVLKRSGVSTSIISESLGHSSEKITQIYLDSFENSQIDEAMSNLL